ncbi:MAG: DUF4190 domain-containing protein [Eubacterium sp.]
MDNYEAQYYVEPPVEQNNRGNGMAIASLCCGIAAIIFVCCCSYLAPILGILAIVFAFISKSQAKLMRGTAIGGLVCGIIGMVLGVVIIIVGIALTNSGYYDNMFQEIYDSVLENVESESYDESYDIDINDML